MQHATGMHGIKRDRSEVCIRAKRYRWCGHAVCTCTTAESDDSMRAVILAFPDAGSRIFSRVTAQSDNLFSISSSLTF